MVTPMPMVDMSRDSGGGQVVFDLSDATYTISNISTDHACPWLIMINTHTVTYMDLLKHRSRRRAQVEQPFGAWPKLATERDRGAAVVPKVVGKRGIRHEWLDARNHRVDKLRILRVGPGFTFDRDNFECPEKHHDGRWRNLVSQVSSRTDPGSLN